MVWQGYYLTNFEQSQLRVVGVGACMGVGTCTYHNQTHSWCVTADFNNLAR